MPVEFNYIELKKIVEDVHQNFRAMNEIGRVYISRFVNLYREEIKEIEFGSRKLGEEILRLEEILRKGYGAGLYE